MENVDWVLVSKSSAELQSGPTLYIKCSRSMIGRSKKGRAVWEWTENFHEATGFASHDALADAIKEHHIPSYMVKMKPYTTALSDWHRKLA